MAALPDTAPAPWSAARAWKITLVLLAGVIAWDVSGWDLQVMPWFGTGQGFALKENWWLSAIMHTRAQQLSLLAWLLLLAMVFKPVGLFQAWSRRQRLACLLAVTASVLAISLLKRISLTSCPWDLFMFGGPAQYIPHWRLGVADGGGGRCFPSGHASSALSFLAICLPGLFSVDARQQRQGRLLLGLVLVLGLVFGVTQTVRGAHYPSHTLWTAWICWTTGWLTYRGVAGKPSPLR